MTSENRLLLQGFEWHTPSNSSSSHYARITSLLPSLSGLGVTSLWLPPGCKANNPQGNGYDIYDLWDLGEFEQKGARRTKWGSKEELEELLSKGREYGVEMIWDAVLNHKTGADGTEECWAVEVDKEDRRYEICAPKKIEAWLQFDFHGREYDGQLKHSNLRWRSEHFNGVDWDQKEESLAIRKLINEPSTSKPFKQTQRPSLGRRSSPGSFLKSMLRTSSLSPSALHDPPPQRPGKGWAEDVDKEHGNNDYLMFSNIDYTHTDVRQDVSNWGRWMIEDIGVQGFRLDAVQHFSFSFTKTWIECVQEASIQRRSSPAFIVGEIWTGDLKRITSWLDAVRSPLSPPIHAYDSVLLYNFSHLSEAIRRQKADLRTILRGSLVEARPQASVTLVTNHDTQPGQTSHTPMPSRLKALWYAFILLRSEGLPCVFWGDLFGTRGPQAEAPLRARGARSSLLGDLMMCRRLFAYGKQVEYWQSKDCIGWTRAGTQDRPGCAVMFSVGNPKLAHSISMAVGKAGEAWIDVLGNWKKEVVIDDAGKGRFCCFAEDVSVYVKKAVAGSERIPVKLDTNVL